MTATERDKLIADLVLKYSDNEKTLAAIGAGLLNIKTNMEEISVWLDHPEELKITDAGIQIGHRNVPIDVDGARLKTLLTDYQQAIKDKKEMSKLLDQAGVGNAIR